MTQFIARVYNRLQVDPYRGIMQKSSDEKRLSDEINYYRELPDELKIWFPRLVNYQEEIPPYRLDLELYAYDNLATYMMGRRFSLDTWDKILDQINSAMCEMKRHTRPESTIAERHAMYVEKTENEYQKLLKNPVFEGMAKHETISLNGNEYKNFEQVWPKVRAYLLGVPFKEFSIIHGDMCFSNMLIGIQGHHVILKLIDPRGSFGPRGCYGDPYYDYAKMAHSIDGGYEFFIYDKFSLSHDSERRSFVLGIGDSIYRDSLKEMFHEFLEFHRVNIRLVNAIQGTIFVGMCARHYDSLLRQQAMYLTGLRLLNQVAEKL